MGSVYRILDTVTGQAYIGASTDVHIRLMKHRRELRDNRHHNQHLQRLWNEHGESAFRFEEIEKIEPWWNYKRLAEREIHHALAYGELCLSDRRHLGHGAMPPGAHIAVDRAAVEAWAKRREEEQKR